MPKSRFTEVCDTRISSPSPSVKCGTTSGECRIASSVRLPAKSSRLTAIDRQVPIASASDDDQNVITMLARNPSRKSG